MSDEEIIIVINGTDYGGWKAADVTRSMDTVCGTFNVSLFDRWTEESIPRKIRPGDECQVFAGGEPVLTGYVDVVSPSISENDHGVTISGRDKTCDIVDCAAEMESFEANNVDLLDLANMLSANFGITARANTDVGERFVRVAAEPGETAFACLDRYARRRGVLCTTDGLGVLVLSSRSDFADSGAALVMGENIKSATATYDFRDRFSTYTAHGQMPSFFNGSAAPAHDQIGVARDTNMKRYRPLFMACESWASCDDPRIRAENECAYRAGRSTRVNITVAGWRHGGGLWQPQETVSVSAPDLYLDNATLVVTTVRYAFADSSGTTTELELTRPEAYLKDCSGQVKEDPCGPS